MKGLIGLTLARGWFPSPFLNPSISVIMYCSPQIDNSFDKYDELRLHMETLHKAHLIEFDISLRILCPLEKAGIRTLGDLVKQTKKELRKIDQLGKISVDKLERFLADQGLSLAK